MAPSGHFTIPGLNTDETHPVGARALRVAVEGWNDRVVEGFLLDFRSGEGLKVLPDGHAKALALRFNQVKRMRLARTAAAPASGFADDPLQTFAVQLRDGSVYSGRCHGCRRTADGLWVFPKATAADDPERVFIPRSAITNYQVQRSDGGLLTDSGFSATLWQEAAEELSPEVLQASAPSTVETPQQLVEALRRQATLKPVPIGEALLGLGKITPEQLAAALQRQKSTGAPLGQTLVEMGLIQPADLQVALARKMGYPFVDVQRYPVDAAALRLVPAALASRLRVLPLALVDGALVVAMADPLQFKAIDELEFTAQRKVLPVVGTAADLEVCIGEIYARLGLADGPVSVGARGQGDGPDPVSGDDSLANASQLAEQLSGESAEMSSASREETENLSATALADNTLVRLVNSMIVEAFHQRASDIHIEPYPGNEKVQVRFRVDGHLRPYLELPAAYRNALVARIKVMCDLDIAERRKPQDGKINFRRFGGLPIELRVATIPTVNGMEDVVMRILSSAEPMPLDKLQLSAENLCRIEKIMERPYGLFLCVGPTGSGKTTTLHAALRHINTPDRKIWTAEDPVEITQRGLRQIQVNPKIGWTFANALRALLRADPDVIMVGEIRDAETAEIAIEASLTGHFVLSTLHTNSAAETVTRLHELGVDPFSFADSLQGILAQRLVRRVCPSCVRYEPLEGEVLQELLLEYQMQFPSDHPWRDNAKLLQIWREQYTRDGRLWVPQPQGCAECGQTGYRGRLAIHELLSNHPELHPLIVRREPPALLRDQAVRQGMRTLRQDGIEKVLMGLTTLAEVRASSNL